MGGKQLENLPYVEMKCAVCTRHRPNHVCKKNPLMQAHFNPTFFEIARLPFRKMSCFKASVYIPHKKCDIKNHHYLFVQKKLFCNPQESWCAKTNPGLAKLPEENAQFQSRGASDKKSVLQHFITCWSLTVFPLMFSNSMAAPFLCVCVNYCPICG